MPLERKSCADIGLVLVTLFTILQLHRPHKRIIPLGTSPPASFLPLQGQTPATATAQAPRLAKASPFFRPLP